MYEVHKLMIFLKIMFSNRIRSTLTILGISLGVFVFTIGSLYISGIKFAVQSQYSGFKYDALLISDNISKENYTNISNFGNVITVPFKIEYQNDLTEVSNTTPVRLVFTTSDFVNSYIPTENNQNLESVNLISGRIWDKLENDEYAQVIVISSMTSKILFGNSDSVGKKIELNDDKIYTVIGIVSDTHESQTELEQVALAEENSLCPYLTIYIPSKHLDTSEETNFNSIVMRTQNPVQLRQTLEQNFSFKQIITRNDIDTLLINKTNSLQIMINTVFITSLIISGLNIMNTLFFSIHEREKEIGIKRSIGASKLQIMGEFLKESVIYSLLSSIIGIIVGTIIYWIILQYVSSTQYSSQHVNIDILIIYKIMGYAIIQGMIFGLLPSIRTLSINTTEAIASS